MMRKLINRVLQLMLIGFFGTPIVTIAEDAVQSNTALPIEELRTFAEVFSEIKNQYVDQVDDATLIEAAIDGMVQKLDKHSAILSKQEYEDLKVLSEGRFFGIGIEIVPEENYILVVAPIDGSPAIPAGIQAGDKIVAVDGQQVVDIGVKNAVEKLKGKNGSKVRLTIKRGTQDLDINVTRGRVKTQTAQGRWLEDGKNYYIRLATFQDTSDQEIRRLVNAANEEKQIAGLILDLRNNPGGTLYAATEVADLFLSNGTIVSIRQRGVDDGEVYSASPDDIINGAPIVVMINHGSASAAEIVAGALQDNDRATIVGSRSFGKGSVQQVHSINNNYAIKLTIAKYITPSGKSIQDKGIVPDILINTPEKEQKELTDEQLVEQRRQEKELLSIDRETLQAIRILNQQ